jgi:hypothetical protein
MSWSKIFIHVENAYVGELSMKRFHFKNQKSWRSTFSVIGTFQSAKLTQTGIMKILFSMRTFWTILIGKEIQRPSFFGSILYFCPLVNQMDCRELRGLNGKTHIF